MTHGRGTSDNSAEALETSIRRGRTVKIQAMGLYKSSPRGSVDMRSDG
jgi:hypothetical protein